MTNVEGHARPAGQLAADNPQRVRFSTDRFRKRDRVPFLRDIVGRQMLRLDIEPLPGRFRVSGAIRRVPGLDVFKAACPPVCVKRTAGLASDGNDDLLFQWTNAPGVYDHVGREIALEPGDAIVLSCADPFSIRIPSAYNLLTFRAPRAVLGSGLRSIEECLARPIPRTSTALKLLLRYLEIFEGDDFAATPELQRAVAAHVHDLLALATAPAGEAGDLVRRDGVRAARLRTVKQDIARNLCRPLSVSEIAARHQLSPRSMQMLFESEGTTLTEFVCMQRLANAYRVLTSRTFDNERVGDIALACGFGDISYFNRKFRARYSATPSDVRRGAK
ncbi:MAG: AraC family transcriptional regulator [Alphaproteobacteria bacterium]